ncbi:hypothetical protein PCE1_001274 [Barthelona sp. PCE]
MSGLINIQYELKKDPEGYRSEFNTQLRRFSSILELLSEHPISDWHDFQTLVSFLCHCVTYYAETELVDLNVVHKTDITFAYDFLSFMRSSFVSVPAKTRVKLTQSLFNLRTKNQLSCFDVYSLLLDMITIPDKNLGNVIRSFITKDIKHIITQFPSERYRHLIQKVLVSRITDETPDSGRLALQTIIRLYMLKHWTGQDSVRIISDAALLTSKKLVVPALAFFLDDANPNIEEWDEEEENQSDRLYNLQQEVTKGLGLGGLKRANKEKKLERARKKLKKMVNEKGASEDFLAIEMLSNADEFATQLMRNIKRFKFNIKLMIFSVVSKISTAHQTFIAAFHSTILRYLRPKQEDVTVLLSYASSAVHQLTPPDVVQELLKAIQVRFVTEVHGDEIMVVGLNAIRFICEKCPHGCSQDILEDLVAYRRYKKSSGVAQAAKSLIQLFRDVMPEVLPQKLRGDRLLTGSKAVGGFGTEAVDDKYQYLEFLEESIMNKEEKEIWTERKRIISGEPLKIQATDENNPQDDEEDEEFDSDFDLEEWLAESDEEMEEQDDRFLDTDNLFQHYKKKKTKEDMLRLVMEGREDRLTTSQRRALKKGGGTSNVIKDKNKNLLMSRHSRKFRARSKMAHGEKVKLRQRRKRRYFK